MSVFAMSAPGTPEQSSSLNTSHHDPPPHSGVVDDTEYPNGLRLFTTLAALVLAIFLPTLDTTILATAIPRITDQFHSLADVGWYASAFFMTVSSSQSVWGKIYKYFDLKTMFLVTITIFEIRSLISGKASCA